MVKCNKKTFLKVLPIKPYDDECKLPREVNDLLPSMNGDVGVFIGRICSGKSNLLSNLILRPDMLGELFETIYLISNTASCDDSSRFLVKEDNVKVFDTYSDELIDKIVNTKKDMEKKDMKWDLIIGDDLLGSLRSNPPCKLYQLATRLRHYAFNMILLTQKMKAISPVVRVNTTFLCVFWNLYGNEIDAIGVEWGNFCGEKGFVYLYEKYIQKDRYSFMYINFSKGIVMKNFNQLLYSIDGGYEEDKKNNNDSDSDSDSDSE